MTFDLFLFRARNTILFYCLFKMDQFIWCAVMLKLSFNLSCRAWPGVINSSMKLKLSWIFPFIRIPLHLILNWMVQLFIIIPVSKSLHDCRRVFNLRFLNYQPVDLLLFTYLFLKEHHNGWQPGALMAWTWKGSQTGQFFYNHNSQKQLLRGSRFGRCRGQAEKWLSFEVWGGSV